MVSTLILPQPSRLVHLEGRWATRPRKGIEARARLEISATLPVELAAQAQLLAGYLREENHVEAEVTLTGGGDIRLALTLLPRPLSVGLEQAGFHDETHRISVGPEYILIEGASVAGVSRGIQSLRQLLSGQRARLTIPCMIVDDTPALGWRGLHLDVSRHFRDAADVKRFIDLAAYHKFNLFHWHLTDDQGWRLPVEGYPRLIEIAAWRDATMIGHNSTAAQNPRDGVRHGGAYTVEEIKSVVAYAAARGVQILPEVDVPGHVQALVTAYPELGNTGGAPGVREIWGIGDATLNLEPETFAFLEKTVATLVELFPFRYLHFGGDEAKTGEWAASARIQERKRELGLATDHHVQRYFTEWLHRIAISHGRRMIGWDEVIEHEPISTDTAVMYWRGYPVAGVELDLKALRAGNPVVLAEQVWAYFDFYQVENDEKALEPLAIGRELPLEKVYEWRPLERYPEELRAGVLGAQGQLWTEYIPTRRHLDYMAYPRVCALAQVLWTGEGREPKDAFERRLTEHLGRLDRLGVAYRPRDLR